MTRKSEAGNVLIFTVLALTVLMGFAGLAVDMGVMRHEKRLQQTAADAAAIAGANNLGFGGVQVGAQGAASANGFPDGSGNDVTQCTSVPSSTTVQTQQVCVEVYNGPGYLASIGQTDPHNGDANYVEAVVATVQPTYFMRIIGINSEVVVARAVATNVSGGSNDACMITLGPYNNNGINGINLTGNATLNATNCGIVDNGNFDPTGNGGRLAVNAASFSVSAPSRGGSGPGGTQTCTSTPTDCPAYNAPAAADPLAYLTAPGPTTPATNWTGHPPAICTTVPCAIYNGISINGGTTNFAPGVYVVTGGNFNMAGNGQITGDGVMFYFTNGSTLNFTGGGSRLDVNLTAPNASNCPSCPSQYDGVLFYQDPNDTSTPTIGGDSQSIYSGALYFPSVQLTFYGNTRSTGYTLGLVVAKALGITGDPTVNILGSGAMPSGVDLIKNAVLVE